MNLIKLTEFNKNYIDSKGDIKNLDFDIEFTESLSFNPLKPYFINLAEKLILNHNKAKSEQLILSTFLMDKTMVYMTVRNSYNDDLFFLTFNLQLQKTNRI